MARRIELPSADVLFGDQPGGAGETAGGVKKQPSTGKPKTAARATKPSTAPEPKTAARAEKPPTAHKPKSAAHAKKQPTTNKPKTAAHANKQPTAHKPKTAKKHSAAPHKPKTATHAKRQLTAVARLEAIEARLGELPVDSLIDLRDGLEELLAAEEVDEQAVRRLLGTVEI